MNQLVLQCQICWLICCHPYWNKYHGRPVDHSGRVVQAHGTCLLLFFVPLLFCFANVTDAVCFFGTVICCEAFRSSCSLPYLDSSRSLHELLLHPPKDTQQKVFSLTTCFRNLFHFIEVITCF